MKFRIALAALAMTASAFGMAQKKTTVTVRFHPEANPNDGASFVMPVKLENIGRNASLSRVPAVNEKQIKAIFPFEAGDGTFGCVFRLDEQGRIRLETMSSEQLNTALVLIVGTKNGQHQVIDMLIDRPVTNGIITVPRGLTPLEVAVMRTQFAVIGEEKTKKKKKSEPKPSDTADTGIDRSREARQGGAATLPVPGAPPTTPTRTNSPGRPEYANPPVSKQKLRELDLPRVAD